MAKEQLPHEDASHSEEEGPQLGQGPEAKRELGFGSRLYRRGVRLINKDGSFNVERQGMPWLRPYDLHNTLISMSWGRFFMWVFIFYFTINLLFSLMYLAVGIENLDGTMGETEFEKFLDAFFFSAQTVTTLGYGRISPMGTPASVIAAIESLTGLLGFALVTGIMYGRFSRPKARLKFSDNMLVAPYEDGKGLMFRIANTRSSELVEVEIQVVASLKDSRQQKRIFKRLDLQLEKVNFLALSWTVNHIIDENSPLWQMSKAELMSCDAEFIILVKAFDDGFSQTVYQRHSYKGHEVVFDAKFRSIIGTGEDNKIVVNLDHINDYDLLES